MTLRTPVIVGVGEAINRSVLPSDAQEPLTLILSAIRAALADTQSNTQHTCPPSTNGSTDHSSQLLAAVDSFSIVRPWSWDYIDLPGLVAKRLGIEPSALVHSETSAHGGHQPAKLVDEACRRVAQGECKVAIVGGGEALASSKENFSPPGWTKSNQAMKRVYSPTTRALEDNIGAVHSVGAPIQVYPMFENAWRAKRGQTIAENNDESAKLYSHFAQIAASNPMAWFYGREPADEHTIKTVTLKNRLICFPYPLLMNAFNSVNIAGICIITSTDFAKELSIAEEKWVYPYGGAGTKEAFGFWDRPNLYESVAISKSLDAALSVSDLKVSDIDCFEFYSCFPIVPKLACHHLGIPLLNGDRPISLLGGLSSYGGAGMNYASHQIIEVVKYLRNGKGKNALVLANGGNATYQHALCFSTSPRADGKSYPTSNPLPEELDLDHPEVDIDATGEVIIEFEKDASPAMAFIVGRLLTNNHRVIANDADKDTLIELANTIEEQIGKTGWVYSDAEISGRTVFTFHKPNSTSSL